MSSTRTVAFALLSLLLSAAAPLEQPPQPEPTATLDQSSASPGDDEHSKEAEEDAQAATSIKRDDGQTQASERAEDGCDDDADGRAKWWWLQTLTAYGTVAATFTAAILGAFSLIGLIKTLNLTRRAAEAAESAADSARLSATTGARALNLSLRPWIVPTGEAVLNWDSPVEVERLVPIRVTLLNAGTAPALDVRIHLAIQVNDWRDPMPEDPKYPESRVPVGIIGPGVAHPQLQITEPWSAEQIRQVFKGTTREGRVTICGRVIYRDHANLPEPYVTRFCVLRMYDGGKWHFVVSGPYNDCT